MSRVQTCITWNEGTQTCDASAWVEQPVTSLPAMTLEEGQAIGDAMVYSLVAIAAIKYFFKPATHKGGK